MFNRKALKAEARLRMREAQPRCWKVMLIWFLAAILAPTVLTDVGSSLAGGSSWEDLSYMLLQGVDQAVLTLMLAQMGKGLLISLFFGIVVALYQCVMNFGLVNYALRLWRREECGETSLLDGFSMVWRVIATQLFVTILTALWAMLFLFPVGGLSVLILSMSQSLPFSYFLLFLLYIGYVVLLVSILLRYSLASLALADDPSLGALGAIKRSQTMMRGHKCAYFMLNLSFLGWSILCSLLSALISGLTAGGLLTLPLGLDSVLAAVAGLPMYLWLQPYMQLCYAGFYDALRCSQPEIPPLNEFPEG